MMLASSTSALGTWRTAGVRPLVFRRLCLLALLEKPPAEFRWDALAQAGLPEKYLEDGPAVDFRVFLVLLRVFENTTAVGCTAWFN